MKIYFIEAERDKLGIPTKDWFDAATHKFFCPSLVFPTIAALTPPDIEIKIIDEKVEEIDFADLPDVAVITFKTMASKRAYEVADIFRKKKVKVIMGGLHVSLLPKEAKRHCDSVVIGEGEEIWPAIIDDLRRNCLRRLYRMPRLTDFSKLKPPRYALLKYGRYFCHSVQTSRGCSLNCDFCPTREMFGGIFRIKPIENVVKEIKNVLSLEKKYIFFTDDIFGAGNKDYISTLLKEIRKLKIGFFIISDFLVLDKKIVVGLARSGCRYICLNMPGTCSAREARAIRLIQMLGIDVWGYFMFGFRFHEEDVFQKVYDFIKRTQMRHVSFTVMAPYPNTKAGKTLQTQGRILSRDWEFYDQAHVVFEPEKMTSQELREGFSWLKKKMGHLSRFSSQEPEPLWRKLTSRCLVELLSLLLLKEESKKRPNLP